MATPPPPPRRARGTVTVDGFYSTTPSTWTNSSSLGVGYRNSGTLNITNGGLVTNTQGSIGGYSGGPTTASGTVTVDGSGGGNASKWTNNALYVGYSGSGSLGITNGGIVSVSAASYVAYGSNSTTSTVTVSGTNSKWSVTNTAGTTAYNLTVGNSGNGSLSITGGGTVKNAIAYIGYNATSTNSSVTVDSSSTWTTGAVYVGYGGTER